MNTTDRKDDYNDEEVFFCKCCLSLRVISIDNIDYCDNCSSTNIGNTKIEHWNELYVAKYGTPFINKKR